MNLSIFFDPLPEELVQPADTAPMALAAYLTPFTEQFPDWRTADLALIGLHEWRGSVAGPPARHGADAVRRQLYQLQKGTGPARIVDLGNLRPGPTLEDTYLRLREIVGALLERGTVPLLLGGSPDLDYGQFLAYETLERPVTFAAVDARVDAAEHAAAAPEASHLRRILLHEPNFLFSFALLAHQQYLVAPEALKALESLHCETLRLGELRADFSQAEPVLRHADFLSFDVAALRWTDAPAYFPANPFGLSGEEAAQLCWYAGSNDQLSSFGLYGYRPDHDPHGLAACVLATMLWYFIEGYYHRYGETDFQGEGFSRYSVDLLNAPGAPARRKADAPTQVTFYESRRTGKWWLEVESLTAAGPRRIVPCSYQDYRRATQGDLPRRWLLVQGLLD